MSFRNCLRGVLLSAAGIAACFQAVAADNFGPVGTSVILESKTGMPVAREVLLSRIQQQEFILMGELHDNLYHHRDRGELIRDLVPVSPVVVAEHLEFGKQVIPGKGLQEVLGDAGFDSKGWKWPRHQSLFEPLVEAGVPLFGGNIPRNDARRIVREGASAIPGNLADLVKATSLLPEAQKQLDDSLIQGHCGQMDPGFLASMRMAQEVKDAAMATTMLSLGKGREKGVVILVAGNGHVRNDYGVPRFLPEGRYVTIGFVERKPELTENLPRLRQQFDYLWITDAVEREDPCSKISMPRMKEAS